ncbi:hypothetical protein [Aliamphritea spongicola]
MGCHRYKYQRHNGYPDGVLSHRCAGGNEFANTLIGGAGNDTLTGGLGSDTFVWNLNDGGTPGDPAADVITDFNTALPANEGMFWISVTYWWMNRIMI